MAQAFFGGVHPNDMKAATNEKAIEQLAPPAQVVIPMSMHFGAPCTPLVKVGDHVKVGQKIGEFHGLGAPIHASVSGTVKAVEPRPYSMGGNMMSVVIDNDFQDEISEEVKAPANPDALSVEEMVEIVKNAGIVGMGGATFPTHVKITSGIGKVDTVIINGAECEPYITGDHRTMLERPEEIIGGCVYLAKMFGVDKVVIGVEDNKQNGIDAMNKVIAEQKAPVVVEPKNIECPIGTPVSCLFDACGGLKDGTYKLVCGGPMMGMAQYTADIPVAKGTGAMLAFCENEEQTVEHPQCIRCGKCVSACPMHLEPLFMYQYASKGMVDELNDAHIMDCMECGACSYICPARMHLTHMFKTGKQLLKDKMAADKAAAEAKKAAAEEKKEAVNK